MGHFKVLCGLYTHLGGNWGFSILEGLTSTPAESLCSVVRHSRDRKAERQEAAAKAQARNHAKCEQCGSQALDPQEM